MEEIWKSFELYKNIYEVSNLGRVRSLFREVKQQGKSLCYKSKILKPFLNNSGYLCVKLSKENKKKSFLIHRLVGMVFLPNPYNYPQINHKDENKLNNRVDNLEWCTLKYNTTYGTVIDKRKTKLGIKICMYDDRGVFINTYKSARDAEKETGVAHSSILECCKKQCYSAGGFIWRFLKETNESNIEPIRKKNSPRTVCQYDDDLKLINKYKSIRSAEKSTGIKHENISFACKNKSCKAGGFYWAYNGDAPQKKVSKKIEQYDLNGEMVKTYESITNAIEESNGRFKKGGIKQCLRGKNKTAYGYVWKYK